MCCGPGQVPAARTSCPAVPALLGSVHTSASYSTVSAGTTAFILFVLSPSALFFQGHLYHRASLVFLADPGVWQQRPERKHPINSARGRLGGGQASVRSLRGVNPPGATGSPAGVQAEVTKGKEIIYSCKHVFLEEQEAVYSLHPRQRGWRW